MNMPSLRLTAAIGLASIALAVTLVLASPIAASRPFDKTLPRDTSPANRDNLLINPDFEDGYTYPLPCCNNIAVPVGWNIRWYTDTAAIIDNITYTFRQPEVKIIDNTQWPFCDGCAPNIPPRIHSGRYAVDSFTLFAAQDTTLYQQVGHIPLGAVVTGSAWLHAWVSSCNPFPQNASILLPAVSLQGPNNPGNGYQCAAHYWPIDAAHMLVGIDPFGGTDPRATAVVWNWPAGHPAWWGPYDYYSPTLPVTATAQSYTVTLFLRGVTRLPVRYDNFYFDAARLIYSFPIEWQIDQAQDWPLSTSITIGLQTPLLLTQVGVELQDPVGDPAPIESLGSTISAPYTQSWRFVPALEGTYRFTVTAHELPDPVVKSIEVQTLTFTYEQDHLLSSGTLSESTLITYVLSSPIALTNLSTVVSDPIGMPLTATLVISNFDLERYDFGWQFIAQSSSWHTVTLNADEFMQPFVRRVLVLASRIYLPILRRD